jgi:metal-responsive CopG/Arc/MetJ family transcriptional regulator
VAKSIRTTVSIPAPLYADLAKAAESGHVSTAWIIRDALRVYFSDDNRKSANSGGGAREQMFRSRGTRTA